MIIEMFLVSQVSLEKDPVFETYANGLDEKTMMGGMTKIEAFGAEKTATKDAVIGHCTGTWPTGGAFVDDITNPDCVFDVNLKADDHKCWRCYLSNY